MKRCGDNREEMNKREKSNVEKSVQHQNTGGEDKKKVLN